MKTIITTILNSLETEIKNLVSSYAAAYEKQTGKTADAYDLNWFEILTTYDLIKSVEKYTANDDVLVSVSSCVSHKGNLEIEAIISRNGVEYRLSTEVIYAGGYNIQRLHYRYITHTNLPQTGNKTMAEQYDAMIKKMTKKEKFQAEINAHTKYMNRMQSQLDEIMNVKPENVIAYIKENNPNAIFVNRKSWDELSEQGKINWESEEKYNQYAIDALEDKIKEFHHDIKRLKSNIKDAQKHISKIQAKIDAM